MAAAAWRPPQSATCAPESSSQAQSPKIYNMSEPGASPAANATFVQVNTPSAAQHKLTTDSVVADDANAIATRTFRPTMALYASVLVALMLPFQFGWSLSQLNLSTFASQPDCNARPIVDGTCLMFPGHTKAQWTYVVNAWIVGGMVGSLSCGGFSDKYGRRKVMMASALFMIVGGIIQASTSSVKVFIVGRLLAGISSGCATTLAGGYANEAAPPNLRGKFSPGVQLAVAIGSLLVVCTFFFANTSSGWRYIAGFQAVWGAIFIALASFLLVESPAWLLSKGKRDEAAVAMARIYGEQHVSLAFTWFESPASASDIETPHLEPNEEQSGSLVQSQSTTSSLLSPVFRRQLIIAIGIASAQQLSGISAVFYYSSSIFKDAGISDDRIGSLIVSLMNFLPTFATGYLATRFGYRSIILFGLLGMLTSAVGMTIALLSGVSALSIVFTGAFVGVFAMSLGPLIYVVVADLFPDSVRGSAMSVCIFFNFLSNLVFGVSFPYIADALDNLSFLPFVAMLAIFYVFMRQMLPETLDKTGDEIQNEFRELRARKTAANH